MSEVITGEAVPLELRLARLPSRMVAFAFDGAIQLILLWIMFWIAGGVLATADTSLATFYFLASVIAIFVALPATVESVSRGRSLGKLIMGMRVVRDDGGPIRFRHALVRALAAFFLDVWILGSLGVGIFTSILSSRGKRVGDYLAGTVVLRERVPAALTAPINMPPRLTGWAAGLELSRLPDELALAARQYLVRHSTLDPIAANHMSQQLAAEVSRYIGRPVPAGIPPWEFLAAVISERRRREIARIQATQRRVEPAAPRYQSQPDSRSWPPYDPAAPRASTTTAGSPSPAAAGPDPAKNLAKLGDSPFAPPA
ncbi:MAG: RDD family protein [Sporichthyaceae bacterium]|nr:RDD family protein [Sporichthyaceae bacterium]